MNSKFLFSFLIIVFINLFVSSVEYSIHLLNKPSLFKKEICSYNGTPKEVPKEGSEEITIECTCSDEYATLQTDNKINDVMVQCNYERKRRFIALFLSIFLPIGLDYLYLQRYVFFVLILLYILIALIGNCYLMIKSEKEKTQNKDEKSRDKTEEKRSVGVLRIIFFILGGIALCFYFVNIFLIAFGVVDDANGIKTINDLKYLFTLYNN